MQYEFPLDLPAHYRIHEYNDGAKWIKSPNFFEARTPAAALML